MKLSDAERELMELAWHDGYAAAKPEPKDPKEHEAWHEEALKHWQDFLKRLGADEATQPFRRVCAHCEAAFEDDAGIIEHMKEHQSHK